MNTTTASREAARPDADVRERLEQVKKKLSDFRRIACFQEKSGDILDSFDMYAMPGGIVIVHTHEDVSVRHGLKYNLDFFNVYGELGRDNKMNTTLADIDAYCNKVDPRKIVGELVQWVDATGVMKSGALIGANTAPVEVARQYAIVADSIPLEG